MSANKTNIIAGLFTAIGYESITVSNTVKMFNETNYKSGSDYAKRALITVEDAQIRWRYDGTNPTSSEGHLSNPMDTIVLTGTDNIKNFRVIRKGSTDANIRITYEK